MSATWDPSYLLDVHPDRSDFTCVGTTKQGRRCRNSFISAVSLTEASTILAVLKSMTFRYRRDFIVQISPKLDRLAELTLCPLWHRDHKHGNCQRPQVYHKWLSVVSAWRANMLARGVQDLSGYNPPPSIISAPPITPLPPPSVLSDFTPLPLNPSHTNTHSIPSPSTLLHNQEISTYGLPSPLSHETAIQPTIAYPLPTGLVPPSTISSTNSAAVSIPSFHDSAYSTAHTDASTDIESLPTGPAMAYPSPPLSPWSMDPPSPTASINSSHSPTSSESFVTRTPDSASSPGRSSNSRDSSRGQSLPTAATFTNALSLALSNVLLTAQPSRSARSSSSAGSSLNSSASRRPSGRTSERSSTDANPLATALATTLATVLTEHLTIALTQELAQSEGLAALAPLFQSAFGTQPSSGRSSRRSSNRSTNSTASNPPDVSQTAALALTPIAAPSPQVVTAPSLSTSVPSVHVNRRPLTDPCYICVLPIDDPEDAVWCRGSCGQNFHAECFHMWAESQVNGGRDIECGFWYAL